MRLDDVCAFLDEYLRIAEFSDVSANGLQVEGCGDVEKIAFAVDACMESFRAAKNCGADMLIVHHGIIWGGISYVRGIVRRRLEYLLKHDLSLYAAHLPLDAHPKIGNNSIILRKLGCRNLEPFGEYRGVKIGYVGELNNVKLEDISARFGGTILLPFGCDSVGRVAAVSGRGGFAVAEAVESGVDVFITGEAEHEAYHIAREGGLNVLFLGHYESEKFGVEALKDVVAEKLGVETVFIDIPTNL